METQLKNTEVKSIQLSGGKKITTHNAIVEGDDSVVSVVRQSYHPIHNQEFVTIIEQMADISKFEIAGYTRLYNGAVVLGHLKNTTGEQFGFNGHQIEDYIVFGNSHNGTKPFFIGTTTNFVWCTNQFSQIKQFETIRHTKSATDRIESLITGFEQYLGIRKKMYTNFEEFKNVPVSEEIIEMAKRRILSIKKEDTLETMSTRKINQIELLNNAMVIEMEELGQNLFGMLNGTTRYVRDLDYKNKSFGNLFGIGQQLNENAYQFANEILHAH